MTKVRTKAKTKARPAAETNLVPSGPKRFYNRELLENTGRTIASTVLKKVHRILRRKGNLIFLMVVYSQCNARPKIIPYYRI